MQRGIKNTPGKGRQEKESMSRVRRPGEEKTRHEAYRLLQAPGTDQGPHLAFVSCCCISAAPFKRAREERVAITRRFYTLVPASKSIKTCRIFDFSGRLCADNTVIRRFELFVRMLEFNAFADISSSPTVTLERALRLCRTEGKCLYGNL